MVLNFGLPQSQGRNIASYDWTDLAEGTGAVVYYGAKISGSYILRANAIYSDQVATTSVQIDDETDFTQTHDIDFDLEFNLSKDISGKGIVMVPIGRKVLTDKSFEQFVVVRFRKVDATGEHELALEQSRTLGNNDFKITSLGIATSYVTVAVDIPKTHFKKGENLRITVEHWGRCLTGDGNSYQGFGHDPANRIDYQTNAIISGANSVLTAYVPYLIGE